MSFTPLHDGLARRREDGERFAMNSDTGAPIPFERRSGQTSTLDGRDLPGTKENDTLGGIA